MSLSLEVAIAVVGGASALATAIFWGAYFIGKYANRIDLLEKRVDAHETRLNELQISHE
jgi:hypothetical protein